MSFQLVEQRQHKAVPVNQLCRVLDISRSGYYTARKRVQVQPTVCEACVHLKAAFAAGDAAYGSRRLRTAVAVRGLNAYCDCMVCTAAHGPKQTVTPERMQYSLNAVFDTNQTSRHAQPLSQMRPHRSKPVQMPRFGAVE